MGESASGGEPRIVTQPLPVLGLDDGGILWAFAASVLVTFEGVPGRRTGEHSNLITGTSTGGMMGYGNDSRQMGHLP
jgi:patatin-like phospholipase/acyl hydrolase